MSNFLAPVVALAANALSRRFDLEVGHGAHPSFARRAAVQQVSDALADLDVAATEIAIVIRACDEMVRARRRLPVGRGLSCSRALTVACAAGHEERLSRPAVFATVGYGTGRAERSELLRRGEEDEAGEIASVWTPLADGYTRRGVVRPARPLP